MKLSSIANSISKITNSKKGPYEVEIFDLTNIRRSFLNEGESFGDASSMGHSKFLSENYYLGTGKNRTLVKTIVNGKVRNLSQSVVTDVVSPTKKIVTTTLLSPDIHETESGDVMKIIKSVQVCENIEL